MKNVLAMAETALNWCAIICGIMFLVSLVASMFMQTGAEVCFCIVWSVLFIMLAFVFALIGDQLNEK